ncbi:OmpA family protein [Acidisoma cladoniae]|jgi:outer membrane protein OmpA-like peptidoglycan-associated protein|uniref:OmpA family protein n=1 Tax=Acidisoma cladoniae TaxID=3040935 RepID=UPI0025502EE7|nr:OmpA family protein [Acidisoma sp. PAMC 29798]
MHRRLILLALASALSAPLAVAAAQFEPSYIVFFEEWSGAIGPSATIVIMAAAKAAAPNSNARIVVTGFSDVLGSALADQDLSQLRAQRVTDRLIADGISRQRIEIKIGGPTLSKGVMGRRVELQIQQTQ